ncbi:DUF5685 family protein [Lachnospiraceae bacterium ZAX-1]
MFGYIIVNKPEMKFKEFDLYQSYYCGLCQTLRRQYGKIGQMTLSYDLTFLTLLLTSLYETDTKSDVCKCIAHPLQKHPYRENRFSAYAADMNLLLSYYQCMDDWIDERKYLKRAMAFFLKGKMGEITKCYPQKAEIVATMLEQIHKCEQGQEDNIDLVAGYFGQIMGEIFAVQNDEWESKLRHIGFFLGKYIYLMDAYEDIEKDRKTGNYNPLRKLYQTQKFEPECERILTMMMAECSKVFEKLPIVENIEILRNILYSGVWCRYEMVCKKRKETQQDV